MEPSQGSYWFDETRQGPATQLVPEWVEQMLGN
jgi:NAD-dependent deacetylase